MKPSNALASNQITEIVVMPTPEPSRSGERLYEVGLKVNLHEANTGTGLPGNFHHSLGFGRAITLQRAAAEIAVMTLRPGANMEFHRNLDVRYKPFFCPEAPSHDFSDSYERDRKKRIAEAKELEASFLACERQRIIDLIAFARNMIREDRNLCLDEDRLGEGALAALKAKEEADQIRISIQKPMPAPVNRPRPRAI